MTFSLLAHCSGRGQGQRLQSHGIPSPERCSLLSILSVGLPRLPAYQVGMPFGRSRYLPLLAEAPTEQM